MDNRVDDLSNRVGDLAQDVTGLGQRVDAAEINIAAIQQGAGGMFQVTPGAGSAPEPTGDNAVAGGSDAIASGNDSSAIGNQSQATGRQHRTWSGRGRQRQRQRCTRRRRAQVKTTWFQSAMSAERRIVNVAAGVAATDAVNLGQLQAGLGNTLHQANTYTDQRIDQLSDDVWSLTRHYRGATASALAAAGLPQAYLPGKRMLAASVGGYQNEYGIAVGLSGITDNGKWIYKGQVSGNTAREWGFSAGIGLQW